jgi:hypothetical protein
MGYLPFCMACWNKLPRSTKASIVLADYPMNRDPKTEHCRVLIAGAVKYLQGLPLGEHNGLGVAPAGEAA